MRQPPHVLSSPLSVIVRSDLAPTYFEFCLDVHSRLAKPRCKVRAVSYLS